MGLNYYHFTVSGDRILNIGNTSLPLQEITALNVRTIRTIWDVIGEVIGEVIGRSIVLGIASGVASPLISSIFWSGHSLEYFWIVFLAGFVVLVHLAWRKPTIALIADTQHRNQHYLLVSKDCEAMVNTKNMIADSYSGRRDDQIITHKQV